MKPLRRGTTSFPGIVRRSVVAVHLMIGLAFFVGTSLRAQVWDSIPPGTRIRLTLGQTVNEWTFWRVVPDSIEVRIGSTRSGRAVMLPLADVVRLQVRERRPSTRNRNALIGLVVGAALGATVALASDFCDADGCHALVAIAGGAVGMGLAAAFSDLDPYRWREVRLAASSGAGPVTR